jgi:hypothetical protein
MTPTDPDPPDKHPAPQGLGPPGSNPLFWGVLLAVVLGLVAALRVDPQTPKVALESEFLFRLIVGLAVAFVAYWVAAALWLAWHRTLFRRIGLGNASMETPEQQQALTERDQKLSEFVETAPETLAGLAEQVETLQQELRSKSD